MHKRFIQLAALITLCLSLVGLAPVVPIHAAEPGVYSVLSTTELDLQAGPAGTHAHLSPNGDLIAYGDARKLCVYSVVGVEQTCAALDTEGGVRSDPESVVWSPDSSKLIFTSQYLMTFNNPGIWVMDAASGEVTKMTGVGYEHARILKDDFSFDLSPQWMPDSQYVVFLRYYQNKGERRGPFANVLDVGTGEIKEHDNLISGSISIYLTGISPDGKLLAYNNDGLGSKIEGGLWLYNFETRRFRRLMTISASEQTARVMSFNADATQMLVTDYSDGNFGSNGSKYVATNSPVHIIDVATGKQMLVDDTRYVRLAGWSPDGKQIAYIVYDPLNEDINGLYITTKPGKPGKLVLAGFYIVPTGREGQPILWADNDTLIISDRSRMFDLTMVKLGVK